MRLRFGIFLAPFHPPGENPTLALQRDLELIQHLDRLGYDEAWIGEHHSAGTEIIASPEIFIAVAAERTRHIKLGTGVVSLSYHNPLWVADRIVLLDHLTRGRVMLGVGPGSLPTDAAMIGVSQADTRELMEQSLDAIITLLRTEQPVTLKNSRWDLREARLHLRPYSNPLFDIAVAAVASPGGPRLAGKHGAMLAVDTLVFAKRQLCPANGSRGDGTARLAVDTQGRRECGLAGCAFNIINLTCARSPRQINQVHGATFINHRLRLYPIARDARQADALGGLGLRRACQQSPNGQDARKVNKSFHQVPSSSSTLKQGQMQLVRGKAATT